MKTNISLVLLGLGLVSGAAYAGTVDTAPMPTSNDINVTAPDQSGMWSFGATAVYMQAANKAFAYADNATSTLTGTTTDSTSTQSTVDQGYNLWFGVDATYAFPGNGRDVTLAYEGFHGKDSNGVEGNLNSPFSAASYDSAKGKTQTNYDAGDLVFGQKLDVGERIRLHPFMGVRYAHIDTQDSASYEGTQIGGNPKTEHAQIENSFNGIGPRLGSDAEVKLGQGFSVRGRLGMSALMGSQSIDNSYSIVKYNADKTAVISTHNETLADQSETRIIPEIDARLGLHYTYDFASNMAMGVEAGWQATNYFNVISDQTSGTGHYDNTSNFGLQGPYARVQFDIA